MADEIVVTGNLRIAKGNLLYISQPTSFRADMDGEKGPTPGQITALTTGTVINLSQLSTPGLARIMNLDDTNYVTIGVSDGSDFFPVLEMLPGETFPVRLSRYVNLEFDQTGTGTSADVNRLVAIANTAACEILIEAFDA